jgi:ABC-type uncharacterized transport system involved in gliding motility auxiliary subunit
MLNRYLFSAAGLAFTGIFLIVSIAVISSFPRLRIDLTQDRLFTLADGTRNIVRNLETPVELLFFYSDEATGDVPQLRAYGNRVQELLREMVIASDGRLSMAVIDPQPFSVEEDLATEFGVQAVPLSQGGQQVYFGLVVLDTESSNRQEAGEGEKNFQTLPLIRPDQEGFLEYEFSRLITLVSNPKTPVVGLLTELNIDGGFNAATGQPAPSWAIMESIRYLYDVRRLSPFTDAIDEDIDILFIVHPQNLEEQTLYAIDQHVMRGGKVMVFVDPNADSQSQQVMSGSADFDSLSSDLAPLLNAWGVEYDPERVLADQELALFVTVGQAQRPITHLGMIGVQRPGFANDIVTAGLEIMNMSSLGALTPRPDASTSFEPLIQSSDKAMLMEGEFFKALTDPSILLDEFEASGERYTVAARITGSAASAFPEGRPLSTGNTDEADTDAVAAETEPAPHLAQSQGSISVIVVADTDFLTDRMWAQLTSMFGQRMVQAFASNGNFVINALDNLGGSADLISIRNRGSYARPFTRVLELQRAADERLRQEETELLQALAETEQQLAALSQGSAGGNTLTPQQEEQIDRFIQQQLETRRKLREVQHQLNDDIESLGSTLKLINTALIPVVLIIVALTMAWLRRRRRDMAMMT